MLVVKTGNECKQCLLNSVFAEQSTVCLAIVFVVLAYIHILPLSASYSNINDNNGNNRKKFKTFLLYLPDLADWPGCLVSLIIDCLTHNMKLLVRM